MEASAAWAPCGFHWTADEEPSAHARAPYGLHEEYASIDIFDSYSLQACLHESSRGQQQPLVEYHAEATQHNPIEKVSQDSFEVTLHNMDMETYSNPISVFQEVVHEFEDNIKMMKMKIHRYPENIRALGDWCTMPKIVAIGPYHHGQEKLKKVEQGKHVAAYHCLKESGCSLEELYGAVVVVADKVRSLYDKDVMAGISYDDFRHMMFFDASFLVQYMVWFMDDSNDMDPSLNSFFYSNRRGFHRDIFLLENQIPWQVVETVVRFRPLPLEEFVTRWRDILRNRRDINKRPFVLGSYDPPHLLGLLRHYIVGSRSITEPPIIIDKNKIDLAAISVSAIELAEIGITLTGKETTELTNMGLNRKGIFFAELSLAPLYLTASSATRLLNMAALELCMTPSFYYTKDEDSAVCSYLLLLSMLVHREEDVHELRTKGILQGGAGLTNKEALEFFTSLHGLPRGSCYSFTMVQIESYRASRRLRTKVHSFIHRKKKTIFTVLSAVVAVFSIFGTLIGILVKLKAAP